MLSSTGKGVLLGLANSAACGLAIALHEASSNPVQVVLTIMIIGWIPALPIGALIGAFAGYAMTYRRVTIASLALVPIGWFGLASEPMFIPLAAIPTLLFALLLEAWTRAAAHRLDPSTDVIVREWFDVRVP
jgi:uncharacterized membrane protein (Fun14 family)